MSGLTKSISSMMFGPYSIDDIPKFTIDYRGMVAYARSKSKKARIETEKALNNGPGNTPNANS